MIQPLRQYARWLHTRWPAGTVEKLPEVREDGSTNVPGLYVVGDLTGTPLLKFSADTGARAVQTVAADPALQRDSEKGDILLFPCAEEHVQQDGASDAIRQINEAPRKSRMSPFSLLDLVIVGGGVSGMAAALEARKRGLSFELLEATEPFSTIVNFPRGKPIYTYPTEMVPSGDLQFTARLKEPLLDELREQTLARGIRPKIAFVERVVTRGSHLEVVLPGADHLRARRVIVAIGRSGNFRRLGVPGEDRDMVYNRLHDPKDFCDKDVLVVGGGDSALETAIAVAQCGGRVTLSYRRPEFSRPKPENVERLRALEADPLAQVAIEQPVSGRVTTSSGAFLGEHRRAGSVTRMMSSTVLRIGAADATLAGADGRETTIPSDAVFSMIGREAPLDFFRRSGVHIRGEMTVRRWSAFGLFLALCVFIYHWKKDKAELPLYHWFQSHGWFPFRVDAWFGALGEAARTPGHLLHVLAGSMKEPTFYYTFAYCACVVAFGVRRIRRRRTSYVKVQTVALMAIQCIPLFILPEIVLPWMGQNGWFEGGAFGRLADHFFPDGSYWRAYGFVLAWPLFIGNFFTDQPLWGWLVVGGIQTFVLIPVMIRYWGKGAYCGWICSCGALAETLGDAHRHKMPHGPLWNRLNLVGQALLGIALLMLLLRILGWIAGPESVLSRVFSVMLNGFTYLNYEWFVDLVLAGIIGLGCYFWFSGRVWCRFACPLAALMHIYARFSRFRIFADKKKCISCNVCTSVCHQGIDVMNFANKGLAMEDPQCVRCSACVQSCPTGVLAFGRLGPDGTPIHDRLSASHSGSEAVISRP